MYVSVIASEAKQSHLPKFKQKFRLLRFARNDEKKHLKVNMNIASIRLKCYAISYVRIGVVLSGFIESEFLWYDTSH
ncbi:MAG: hypothetical protein BWY09_01847 [Candidatus Hydrogenedentes bacterium ADurb.Bin179]|nr:MAG: hypothetical protein BWY09_01847 [Candidatus Hydrogenedentes bacterium ADurb.Bin179]